MKSLRALLLSFCFAALTASAHPEATDDATAQAVRAAVDKVQPAVVTIETVGGIGFDRTNEEAHRRIAGLANPGEGPATGLIVDPHGLILTSTFNFIRKPRIITVTLHDGRRYVAELLGRDDTRKVCLLKLTDDSLHSLPTADIAPADELKIGQWAIAMGVGYGSDTPAVSTGIISALGRARGRAVQTDANLSPANYGGPLIDINGRVIGIITPLNPRQPDAPGAGSEWYDSGIGFAIPLEGLDTVIERMAEGETLSRGLMGISPANSNDSEETPGVVIARLAAGGPADAAGLKTGDRITHIDQKPVASFDDLAKALGPRLAGDQITVTYVRGDETPNSVTLTLVASAELSSQAADEDEPDEDTPPPTDPDAADSGDESSEDAED